MILAHPRLVFEGRCLPMLTFTALAEFAAHSTNVFAALSA